MIAGLVGLALVDGEDLVVAVVNSGAGRRNPALDGLLVGQ